MKLVELQQGSPDWLEFRRNKVTATDFSVIAANKGLCKNLFYKKIDKLIEDKISSAQIPDNRYFQLGRELEPIILNSLNFVEIVPGEIGTYENNNRIMASFDARDTLLNCVIEIKTSSKDPKELPKLIDFYKFQVIHQCYVSGYDFGYLVFGFYKNAINEFFQIIDFNLIEIEIIKIIPSEVLSKNDWLDLCNEFLSKLGDK